MNAPEGRAGLVLALWLNWGSSLGSITVLYYDYLLTLGDEIEYIWFSSRLWSPTSIIFFLNRYIGLLSYAGIMYETVARHTTHPVCTGLQSLHHTSTAVIQVLAALAFLLRVQALYNSRKITLALSAMILGTGVAAVWSIVSKHQRSAHASSPAGPLPPELPGCNLFFTKEDGTSFGAAWTGVLVFDFSIFLLTVNVGLRQFRNSPSKLWRAFMLNGALYFIALFFANLANILACFLAAPVFENIAGTPTNALCTMLVSRLIIDLRAANARLIEERQMVNTTSLLVFATDAPPTASSMEIQAQAARLDTGLCEAERESEAGPSTALV